MPEPDDDLPPSGIAFEDVGRGYFKKRHVKLPAGILLDPALWNRFRDSNKGKNPLTDFRGWLDRCQAETEALCGRRGLDRDFWRRRIPRDSPDWLAANLLKSIRAMRIAIRDEEDPLRIAGYALMLGHAKAELDLAERIRAPGDDGNARRKLKAAEREKAVRRIVEQHNIDIDPVSAAATAVCEHLPQRLRQKRAIELFLSENRVQRGTFWRLRQNDPL